MARRKRRAFTPEFKAEAVRLTQLDERSIAQVATDLDLTETALREWVKRAAVEAGKGPAGALTTAEREELMRLRRDVKRLEMEREILKKALLQQRAPRIRVGRARHLLVNHGKHLLSRCRREWCVGGNRSPNGLEERHPPTTRVRQLLVRENFREILTEAGVRGA